MAVIKDLGIFEKMVKLSVDLQCVINSAGQFVFVNDACTDILGYPPGELLGRRFSDFIKPSGLPKTMALGERIAAEGRIELFENCYLHKLGHEVPIEWSSVWSEEEEAFFCIGRNATEKAIARQKLKEKDELHKALIEYGADMLALLNEDGTYTYVGGSTEKILGYGLNELVGKNAFTLIHPDDVPRAQEAMANLLQTEDAVHLNAFRFKAADGSWKWVDSSISNQLHNPSINALVVSSRDVTEQTQNSHMLEESEQKYRNLFEKNPDAIFQQSTTGEINQVNPAFQQVLGYQQSEVVNRPVSSFMPPEIAMVCMRYFHEALLGNTMRFDLELETKKRERKIFDMVMYPLSVNGEIIGVETITKDITSMVRAYETIQQQSQRLGAVLESITDAFFTLDQDLRLTYVNQELERLLEIDKVKSLGKSIDEVFPEAILKEFHQNYQKVQQTGTSVAFDIFLDDKNRWLGVKFFPADNGLSVYLLDITERVAYQRELKMLSLVASKTTNGVVIMDGQQAIQWVNEGFTNLTGYALPEVHMKRPSDVLQGVNTNPEATERIFAKYDAGEPFSEEVVNYKKSGEEYWVKIEVTPIKDAEGKVARFIAIQTDITNQKKADESQAQLTQELYRQNRDLQQFTYIVSHNLRAPVANVIGLSNLLNILDKHSANFDIALVNLEKSILSIDHVLKDLNTILSVGFNKDTIYMDSLHLAAICQEATESLQESVEAFGAQVSLAIPPDIKVHGNKPYLFSIFHNLLSNAIKFRSPRRGLEINVRAKVQENRIEVYFTDNGLGFDTERAGNKVFKLYKRFHREIAGRGIGLFLVKTQLDAMGGDIEVSSQVEAGTQFLIHLPIGKPD